MTSHQDSLRLLDDRAPAEGALQALVFAEPLQGDVDRALQLLRSAVDDVREYTPLRRLVNVCRIIRMEQRDHGARSLTDDLGNQTERMLRRDAEPDDCDVGLLSRGRCADVPHIDL